MAPRIRHAALAIFLGFLVVSFGAAYWQIVRGARLRDDAGNPRIAELSARQDRGTIWSADGVALVRSEVGPDGRRQRLYALPSLAQTLGYVSVTYGVSGLEESFNGDLGGDRAGDTLEQLIEEARRGTRRGNDLVLTVDARIQQAAATALGDRRGAVVALDPRSGAVLAIVSAPAYDPAAIDEVGEALQRDPKTPLINRATQGQYTPGSVFKTITAAAALESGEYRPDARFRCVSALVVEGFVIPCKGPPAGVGEYDFAQAYAWSVNATFAEIGLKIGADRLSQMARRLGFGERIPFDLPVAPSRLLSPGSSFDSVLLADTAYGQGELIVTPLEMALVAAAVANNGVIMQPYLVAEVRGADGVSLRRHQPGRWRQPLRPETAAALRGFMATAVREGFSGGAAVPGVQVGGKTGTAENAPGRPPHAWFTGIAPVENPSVVVAVIVENGGQGADAAAPIARAVFAAALGR